MPSHGHPPPEDTSLREELRSYYRPLLPYFERSLAGRGDLEFWQAVAGRHEGGRFLELGVGTGRVTRVLAPPSRRTVGLDLNLEMLRRARRRLASHPQVRLLAADMRTFALNARFDLAAAANDPFSHLRTDRDRDRALERVARHLADGGRFVLDGLWLTPAQRQEAASADGRTVERRSPAAGGRPALVTRSRWHCDPETRRCTIRYEYRQGERVVARTRFRGRYWTMDEVKERFSLAGLVIEDAWGSYERAPWSPQSEHLLVAARRRRGPATSAR